MVRTRVSDAAQHLESLFCAFFWLPLELESSDDIIASTETPVDCAHFDGILLSRQYD